MSTLAALAELGDFALSRDSLASLFRRATALVTEALGVDRCTIVETHECSAETAVMVAISAGGPEPWGALAVHSAEPRKLTSADVDFLRAVASILGQAIARDRAEDALHLSTIRQGAIAELSRLTVQPLAPATLARACDLIIERIGVDHSVFFALDAETQVLRFRAGNRWFEDSLTLPLTATSQGAECVARNEPVIVNDYTSDTCDTRFSSARSLLDGGVRSGIVVPVSSASRCLGIITAHSRAPRTFSEEDIVFIEAVANLLAEATERDEARHELAMSENRYRDVVETAPDVIFTISASEGRFLSLNAAFERVTGYRVEDWLGRTVFELADPEESASILAFAQAASREPAVAEIQVECPRGTILLELSMHARMRDGIPNAIHGFARDVTEVRRAEGEQRKLEAKLEQANRIAGLGHLAATVAHEFNNVLMGIAPFVDVMRRGKSIESALDHISRSVARGRRITQDILRFTQPAEPTRADLEVGTWLQTIVEEARSLVKPACGVNLKMPAERLHVRADASQLQQVFTNLILNARDAMPGGGDVTIELRHEPAGAKSRFALSDPELYAHLVVSDTGCGMNPEMLRHAFEPLFTTKRNGTGLGLPVALQVVQRHGGELFVESTPGAGTTFHIFLPLAEPQETSGPQRVFRRTVANANAKFVVLVEDDLTVGAGIVSLLAMEGMAVRLARTGEEAISILRRVQPDLLILDVGLPDMDGTQVYLALEERLSKVPVIFSTGHADRTKIEDLLGRANVGFLLKPYEQAELLEMMASVMTSAKAA